MYRDEFDLAILKMQEDNRLEILKRKWWDGGKCPKEEDHRAKGLSVNSPSANFSFSLTPFSQLTPLPVISFHLSHLLLWTSGLGMENIGGIFVVLVCGLLVAIFMAVLEFVWMLRQTPGNEVREGYLTCVCFVSLSPPWLPSPRGAARLPSFQLWEEVRRAISSLWAPANSQTHSVRDIISTNPKKYLSFTSLRLHAYVECSCRMYKLQKNNLPIYRMS